jgi:hypothetical protein
LFVGVRGAQGDSAADCDALRWRCAVNGVPAQILTDNGKVFTGRFGNGAGEVLFDRVCPRTASSIC